MAPVCQATGCKARAATLKFDPEGYSFPVCDPCAADPGAEFRGGKVEATFEDWDFILAMLRAYTAQVKALSERLQELEAQDLIVLGGPEVDQALRAFFLATTAAAKLANGIWLRLAYSTAGVSENAHS